MGPLAAQPRRAVAFLVALMLTAAGLFGLWWYERVQDEPPPGATLVRVVTPGAPG